MMKNTPSHRAKGGGMIEKFTFTEEDLRSCWPHREEYLLEMLNGDYPIDKAREDLKSIIGSKYDPRTVPDR